MGVRPTDLYIGDENSKGAPVRVAVFEDLCSERRIGVRVGKELVILITEADVKYSQGDWILLEVKEGKTHLFDLQTTERIRA